MEVAEAPVMTNLSNLDLARVIGGAGTGDALCTPDNPQGQAPQAPKPPQQFMESSHAGPSANDRVMNSTNTMTSRGMSMFNDNRPSMPDQW